MITTYKDKNKNRIQIITAYSEDFGAAVIVKKNGKLIISDLIRESEVEFHLRKRAKQKRPGIEIDMEYSDVLE